MVAEAAPAAPAGPAPTSRRRAPAPRGRGASGRGASGFAPLRRPGLAGLLVVLVGCGEEPPRQRAAEPPTVPVSRPLVRQVSDWDEFTGRFVATAEVQIRARASGYLTGIHFQDGQMVEAGDVLFTIDPRPYQAAVQAAQAAVAETRATLDVSRTEFDRAAELLRTQAAAQAVVDQRAAAVRRGEAQLALAQANLLRAQLDLEYTVVRAPFAGRIDRHYVSVGNLVTGDATVLSNLVALDPIHFQFDVDQAAHLRYTRAAERGERPSSRDAPNPVRLQLADEAGFPHEGRVDFVSNQADRATGTVRARALVGNDRMLFLPGTFGRVRLLGSAPYEAVMLPDAAVGTDQSRRFVYVLDRKDVPEQKQVELGRLIDGLRVVRAGVGAEDRVVVGGLQRVRPGQRVTPRDQPIEAPAPARLAGQAGVPAPGGGVPSAPHAAAEPPRPRGDAARGAP